MMKEMSTKSKLDRIAYNMVSGVRSLDVVFLLICYIPYTLFHNIVVDL